MSQTDGYEAREDLLQDAHDVAAAIEALAPEAIRVLGSIATIADAGPDQDFVHGLNDVTERIIGAAEDIFSAVSSVPTRPVKETEQKGREVTPRPLTPAEEAIKHFALEGTAFRLEEVRRELEPITELTPDEYTDLKGGFAETQAMIVADLATQGATATWVKTGKARGTRYQLVIEQGVGVIEVPPLPERADVPAAEESAQSGDQLPEDITMSDNERIVVERVIEILSEAEGRVSVRDLIPQVFGRSKLPRDETKRLVQLLDQCSDYGVTEGYGHTYAIGKVRQSTVDTATFDDSEATLLGPEHIEIMKFITERLAGRSMMNIGEIVRGISGEQTLPRDEFDTFLQKINYLTRLGKLTQDPSNPSWYGIDQDTMTHLQQEEQPLPSITTLPLGVTAAPLPPEQPAGGPASPEKPQPATPVVPTKAAKPEEAVAAAPVILEDVKLSEREVQMLERVMRIIKTDTQFRRVDIDATGIEFPSKSAESQAFAGFWNKLISAGYLEVEGERGGRRYTPTERLIAAKQPAAHSTEPSELKPAKRREPEALLPEWDDDTLSAREQLTEERRAITFAGKLAVYVADQLQYRPDRKDQKRNVAKAIANTLGVERDQANALLDDLMAEGVIYSHEARGGYRYIGLDAPEGEIKAGRKSERAKKTLPKHLLEGDDGVAEMVFRRLLDFKHVQQGISLADLVSELGIGDDIEEDFRRAVRRLHSNGYLVSRKANLNTRSNNSKKIYTVLYQFPGQQAKERAKTAMREVMDEIRAKIAEPEY